MTEILQKLGMPAPASSHAQGIDDFIGYIHLLMLALFIGWMGYYVLALFRFRKGANPKADYTGVKSSMSTYLEIGVALIEAVLLVGFAIPLWAHAVDEMPVGKGDPKTDPIELQIMGMQFKWNAHFAGPDGKMGRQIQTEASQGNPFGIDAKDPAAKDDVVCVAGEPFKLPVNREAICRISSMDVIHSFKVAALRVGQDAIPGMSIPVHFKPTKIGKFVVTCAQLCGSGHSVMRGDFEVVSQEDFDKWFAEKSKAGGGGNSFE
ncbi:MAG: cytochrome c oxidase subunit II [Verrucomicrobia bacterium]|nr:MAG: cytochrome c oxidase subunit II [Verrucomicrobiota bacterium]